MATTPWIPLAQAPPGCPWRSAEDALAGWSAAAPGAKTWMKALASGPTLDAALSGGRWYLRYRFAKASFVGGPPAPTPTLPKALLQAGRVLPPDLAALYVAHDGFGRVYDIDALPPEVEVVGGLVPLAEIELLSAVCGRTHSGEPIEDPEGFMAVTLDSVGDRLGIYKQFAGRPYKDLMLWDRHTHEVSKVGPVLGKLSAPWAAAAR